MSAVATEQNLDKNLERRAAINRLYGKAKFWGNISFIVGILSLGFAVVDEIFDQIWIAGALAALVGIVDQAYIKTRQAQEVTRAVQVQEDFDCDVLNLPRSAVCPNEMIPGKVLQYAENLHNNAQVRPNLMNWYPVRLQELPEGPAALLAQQCSASWAHSNLTQHSRTVFRWLVVSCIAPVVLAAVLNMDFVTTFLRILLPVGPLVLALAQLHFQNIRAERELSALLEQVRGTWRTVMDEQHTNVAVLQQARVIQDQLFTLRGNLPLVPEYLHKRHHPTNETNMTTITNREVDLYLAKWPVGP